MSFVSIFIILIIRFINDSYFVRIRTQKYVPYQEIIDLNNENIGKSKARTKYRYEVMILSDNFARHMLHLVLLSCR